MRCSLTLSTLCFILLSNYSLAQGCSDAGVCSLGSLGITQYKLEILKPIENSIHRISVDDSTEAVDLPRTALKDSSKTVKNKNLQKDSTVFMKEMVKSPIGFFQLSAQYGLGERSTSVMNLQVEANLSVIKQKLFAQVKIPYTYVSGKLGSISGLGDVTLSLSAVAFNKKKSALGFSLGAKLPLNDANLYLDGRPLPMVYQTSLGSYDILGGMKYSYSKWEFTIGYQHPFNSNKNNYLRIAGDSDLTYSSYSQSRMLKRSDDAIFRINRNFYFHKNSITPGLLFIVHLADDEITNSIGERVKVAGSNGLTLNANIAGNFTLSKRSELFIIAGSPLITRKAGPDGLKRAVVAIAGLRFVLY